MRAVNIIWDIDSDDENDNIPVLPSEVIIPKSVENDEDAISDYLSDITGYCHYGFDLVRD